MAPKTLIYVVERVGRFELTRDPYDVQIDIPDTRVCVVRSLAKYNYVIARERTYLNMFCCMCFPSGF